MAKKFENYKLDGLLAVLGRKKKLLYQNFGVMDLAVFGSYARNQQNKESDIDIYVKLKKEFKTFDNLMELRFFLEEMLDRKVDLVTKESIREELQPGIFTESVHV